MRWLLPTYSPVFCLPVLTEHRVIARHRVLAL
jgi:hypothetical protein